MEKRDSLWPGGPIFYVSDDAMKPSTDSFLLADFARCRAKDTVMDLGAGSGILGLLLLARQPGLRVVGVECNERACALARRNFAENGMTAEVLMGDLREIETLFPRGGADIVISNPPYFEPEAGIIAPGERGTARAELSATLDDVCTAADIALKYGGEFFLIYRAERLADLLEKCRAHHLEPKRMRLVQHRRSKAPELVLLACKKGGHSGLRVEVPLWIENEDGTETEDVKRAYFRDKE